MSDIDRPLIPYTDSLHAVFVETARRHARRPALLGFGGQGDRRNYAQLLERTRRLATGTIIRKLTRPGVIGLMSENRIEWPEVYLAVLAAGATVVPIDAALTPDETARIIDHAGLETVFCSDRLRPTIESARPETDIISFDDRGAASKWRELLSESPGDTPTHVTRTAALIYTSGTTGRPKAVELTHANLRANLKQIQGALVFDDDDVFLSLLPLHHTFEATCGFLRPLTAGSRVVYARSLKSRDIIEDIRDNRATIVVGVPLLYEKMYQAFQRRLAEQPALKRAAFQAAFKLSAQGFRHGKRWGKGLFGRLRREAGLDSIRMFISGGAPLAPRVARFFNLLGFDLLQGYGLTECSPVVSVNRPDDIRFDSVGPPLPGIDVRIDRPEPNGIGEVILRGDNNTPGYRGNPEQTATLLRDGWLHTGDLGRIEKGHLYITGRAKNVIVSAAGKNIYPEEIEERIMDSPYVAEVVVFGRTRARGPGEEVRAILVPNLDAISDGLGLDRERPDLKTVTRLMCEAVEAANERLALFKRIIDFEVQLEELEKTSTRKIKRFVYE